MPHRSYLECLRNSRESISEVMESFVRSTFMHNDTFDGAATFLFNLMLSFRVTAASPQNSSYGLVLCFSCSWTLEKAISSQVLQVLRILRSLSGPHVCGYSSRWSAAGRRGHLTVWEFMKRTKMTGRVFYLLRSVVHLMETTKTLEYLQWLLQQLSSFDLGSHGCDRVLMQMRHCSLCAGYPLVHPCPAFCEVSLARCLRPINRLQSSWTNLINTLYDQLQAWSNFTNPMIRSIMLHAPQAILEFHRVIMKAVVDEVPQECRIDLVTASPESDDSLDYAASIGRKRATTPVSTQTQFMRISHKLQSLKRLWVSAPSKICRDSPHLSSSTAVSSQACWNGTAIGPYVDGTYFAWDSGEENNEASAQWMSQWSPSNEDLFLNRMSTDNEPVVSPFLISPSPSTTQSLNYYFDLLTNSLLVSGMRVMAFILGSLKQTANGTQSRPRDPTRLEGKTDSERLKYQGMLFVILC
ncbi:unnamed protein product [Taenia asiatica]|uniref:Glypican-1 n=1 Tax=Taenia asiatica TaxID=60517 RepID=A0A0R3W745_TAEAS|nr:unnamed protein product [Taenia asiatica]